MPRKIDVLRGIVQSGRPGVVDRILVSPQTAAKLCDVHDRLSSPFQKKFLSRRVDVMNDLIRGG